MTDSLVRPGLRALIASQGTALTRDELLNLSEQCQKWAEQKSFELFFSGNDYSIKLDASLGLSIGQHLDLVLDNVAAGNFKNDHFFKTLFPEIFDPARPMDLIRTWCCKRPCGNRLSIPAEPFTVITRDYIPQSKNTILVVSNKT